MDHVIYLYGAFVLIAAALAGITIRAPRALWVKISALVLAALLMVTAYASLADLLGRPKSIRMEWAKSALPEATVLAASMREGKAIYLWLRFDGTSEPRAYVLPWKMATAKRLQNAMGQAQAQGTAVRMARPFQSNRDPNTPLFYAEPQPALPPKTPRQ